MPHDPATIPVIVGVGELADRAPDPAEVREPAALMYAALLRAEADAGGALLGRLDRLSIINEISWPYADPVGVLCDRLGHRPAHAVYGRVGGETPVAAIHEAAQAIAR
ncbi:acetyl-CoA acetyltransferase, partial [Acidisphaera rubrifaciens]|uniref:acetyl-CoA acetyltransferase n=1 Tax=Acidisphaera rubrifaciens TaxID=50715 RepID=UPI0006620226